MMEAGPAGLLPVSNRGAVVLCAQALVEPTLLLLSLF